jgi:5-methylcytosine-specific restriction endonuclease McrA
MTTDSITLLSDRDLLDATTTAVARERRTTAELIALLAELDTRKLYLGEGFSSLFTYCTQALHLSEPAAYSRITAARAARRFPRLLTALAHGDITLTTITLLAAELTDDNSDQLIDAARHKSKRDIERLVASLHPQPDIPSTIRKIPESSPARLTSSAPPDADRPQPPAASLVIQPPLMSPVRESPPRSAPVAAIAPIATDRYLLRVTMAGETYRRFERARALLRHQLPTGDPAAILDRALTVLVDQLEYTKAAQTSRPRRSAGTSPNRTSRRIPAAVRRVVWRRDEARCAYVGTQGRCVETAFLEFHHVRPFADGGDPTVENVQLRCRGHNHHEAKQYFGAELCPDRANSA